MTKKGLKIKEKSSSKSKILTMIRANEGYQSEIRVVENTLEDAQLVIELPTVDQVKIWGETKLSRIVITPGWSDPNQGASGQGNRRFDGDGGGLVHRPSENHLDRVGGEKYEGILWTKFTPHILFYA